MRSSIEEISEVVEPQSSKGVLQNEFASSVVHGFCDAQKDKNIEA
jgi:hypothetical protein